ncbi:hypothetical protein [Litorimonas haliclonae]|uniref:hypothetical protein n=1 Tax=Litorimonas haliclonae TaxID=2081977 RepID=UPI0039F014DE
MKRYLRFIAIAAILGGCSTSPKEAFSRFGSQASNTASAVTTGKSADDIDSLDDAPNLGEAVLTPLGDINLRKSEIPYLLESLENPYLMPADSSCNKLMVEIDKLTQLLGNDVETAEDSKGSMSQTALNAVSSTVGGLIPFRSLIRRASGASKYEKEVEQSYRKGVARRGYLKGIAATKKC